MSDPSGPSAPEHVTGRSGTGAGDGREFGAMSEPPAACIAAIRASPAAPETLPLALLLLLPLGLHSVAHCPRGRRTGSQIICTYISSRRRRANGSLPPTMVATLSIRTQVMRLLKVQRAASYLLSFLSQVILSIVLAGAISLWVCCSPP